jgi:hypothetical protein
MNKYFSRKKKKESRETCARPSQQKQHMNQTHKLVSHTPKPETANNQKTKAKKAIPHNQTKPKED